jgi:murein lipoprotein
MVDECKKAECPLFSPDEVALRVHPQPMDHPPRRKMMETELASLKSQIDQASADAAAAKAEAAAASRDAAAARTMAEQANNTANQAMGLSRDTDSKIDRMFKKAMYK